MKPFVLWLVGEPGVGKTTVASKLLGPTKLLVQKPKWTRGVGSVMAAGHYLGGAFDGADTVPYNGARECLDFWEAQALVPRLTILDGDRFSNQKAVDFFRASKHQPELLCIHLHSDPALVLARRQQRSTNVQNASWVKGRATKARNFFASFPEEEKIYINSDAHLTELAVHFIKERLKGWA